MKNTSLIIGLLVGLSMQELHAMHPSGNRFTVPSSRAEEAAQNIAIDEIKAARAREAAAQANRGGERKIMVAAKAERTVKSSNDPLFEICNFPSALEDIVKGYAFEPLNPMEYFEAVTTKRLEDKSTLLADGNLANGYGIYVLDDKLHLGVEYAEGKSIVHRFNNRIEGFQIIGNYILVYFEKNMALWDGLGQVEVNGFSGPIMPREFVDNYYLYTLQSGAIAELKTFYLKELEDFKKFIEDLNSSSVKKEDGRLIITGKMKQKFLEIQAQYPSITQCLMSQFAIATGEAQECTCVIL
jgi:hypothetical protein